MRLLVNRPPQIRSHLLPLVGLLLVPLAVAGLLAWSWAEPADRLRNIKAAIVNNDKPVAVNGQLAPIGRQLAAKLVGDEIKNNYDWEFATPQTAADGLRDGTYVATVTIPENFSSAATSFSRDPAQATRATIEVIIGERSRQTDETISRLVTATAADLLSRQLTATYLDNIYVGFNTLGDKLGDTSKGATSLADGAKDLTGGIDQLSSAADELAHGARSLDNGLGELGGGATRLAQGTQDLSEGLTALREQTAQLPQQATALADGLAQEAAGVRQLNSGLQGLSQSLSEISKECLPPVPMCTKLLIQAETAKALVADAGQLQQASEGVSGGLAALAGRTPEFGGGLPALPQGIDQLAGGATELDNGARALADGLTQSHGGATQLAEGATQLAGGAQGVADSARKLGDATGQLSSGLDQAANDLPSFPDSDRGTLAEAVAQPVTTDQASAISLESPDPSLYAVLALWIGAVVTFLVLRPIPKRVLESTRSSFRLAVDQFALPAGLAVAQGLLVTMVAGIVQDLSTWQLFACAGLLGLIALAFTAVNHALAAISGGAGRFAAVLVGLIMVVSVFASAVPAVLDTVLSVLPTGPAQDALTAVTDGTASTGGTIAALVAWTVSALVVTYLAIARNRTVRNTQLRPHRRFHGTLDTP